MIRLFLLLSLAASAQDFTNSVGMRMVRVPAGSFEMGETARVTDELLTPLTYPRRDEMARLYPKVSTFALPFEAARKGDFDEHPVHRVRITRDLHVAATEVTNAQYEQYDPAHRALRGKAGFSRADDEAVVFVSWYEARAFCQWLSQREGKPYRLPTEAEWEYFARAGTRGLYSTGDALPAAFLKNARNTEFDSQADIVPLRVAQTPPNPWGLHDVHGNVEEWTADWYGPYIPGAQADPTGRAAGDFRVTRGGSHGTDPYYLRSANRLATLPATRNFLVGFRVVQGDAPRTAPLPAIDTRERVAGSSVAPVNPAKPFFRGPLPYVNIPPASHGPLFSWHNHDTAIAECPNGDLLAIWYTCEQERGRELAVASARLRKGATQWDAARPFWDAPDRNDHAPALWFDGDKTLYHFNGLGLGGRWEPLALVMRTSTDSGATWSRAELIAPEYGYRNMLGQPVFRTKSGAIVLAADAQGGSTVWVSRDNGATWTDAGGNIRGIHAGVAEMSDGPLVALGRGQDLAGFSPRSVSADMGKSWTFSPSGIPPLGGGQRLVLMRLKEGPLFLASFAEDIENFAPQPNGMRRRPFTKLFGALSFDDGKTWPVRRVIPDATPAGMATIDGGWIAGPEAQGYLSGTQARDGVIHLISSWNHYAFNVAWLRAGSGKTVSGPAKVTLPSRPLRAGGAFVPTQGATFTFAGPGEFVFSARTGPLTANRYRVRIAAEGVSYWRDGEFRRAAAGTAVHLAIRPDTAAQLYIDGKLAAVEPAELVIDWRIPARGTHWEFTGGTVQADLTGPSAP